MIFSLAFLASGLLFCWLAVLGWRHRREERISLIEAAILKSTGTEPLPLTRFDRGLQMFQMIMMTVFGPVMVVIGIAFVLLELGYDI